MAQPPPSPKAALAESAKKKEKGEGAPPMKSHFTTAAARLVERGPSARFRPR